MRDDKNVQAVLDLFPLLQQLSVGYERMSVALMLSATVTDVGEHLSEDKEFFAAAAKMEKLLQKLLWDTVSDSAINGACEKTA